MNSIATIVMAFILFGIDDIGEALFMVFLLSLLFTLRYVGRRWERLADHLKNN